MKLLQQKSTIIHIRAQVNTTSPLLFLFVSTAVYNYENELFFAAVFYIYLCAFISPFYAFYDSDHIFAIIGA